MTPDKWMCEVTLAHVSRMQHSSGGRRGGWKFGRTERTFFRLIPAALDSQLSITGGGGSCMQSPHRVTAATPAKQPRSCTSRIWRMRADALALCEPFVISSRVCDARGSKLRQSEAPEGGKEVICDLMMASYCVASLRTLLNDKTSPACV